MSHDEITFAQLALAPELLRALDEAGYQRPSPIQAQTIPALLQGSDLLGQAQTGTGKTAAFALPLLNNLDLSAKAPQALILAPTRELAGQVTESFKRYGRFLGGLKVLPIYGGQGYREQLDALRKGVHVIVGTPGRILDHLQRGTLDLSQLKMLVLDEADEMLRMGFIEDVEMILKATPAQRQVVLFSATMPREIRRVADSYLREPVEVRIAAKTATADSISQEYYFIPGNRKIEALSRIVEAEEFDAMIIFARTKQASNELADHLSAAGYAASALNGDMTQVLRERTVESLKRGAIDIVVATDVAARGLDVARISHVLNYDLPTDLEAYVHRIGRTGRAGREGKAIALVSARDKRLLQMIERHTRSPIKEAQLPTLQELAARRVEQFKQKLVDTLERDDLDVYAELVNAVQAEREIDAKAVAVALLALFDKDRQLHAAPEADPLTMPRRERPARNEGRQAPRIETRPSRKVRGEQPRDGGRNQAMIRYRIAVGRDHGVAPRQIVGAIANEGGIEGRNIGHIKLYDDHSTVDLPKGMPKEVFNHLKRVWVCGRQLAIQKMDEAA